MSLDLPTFDELYDAGKAEVQSRNPRLTDWNEGSNLDAVTGAGAVQADEVVRIAVDQFAAHFVDTAEGDQLDTLGLDRFGLVRKTEESAIGTLTFTRVSGVGVITIPAGTTVEAEVNGAKITVATDDEAEMASSDNTVDVVATCTVSGTSGNLAAGVLDDVTSDVPDDPDITVTNAQRFVGGRAAETDEEFRVRIRRYFQTVQKATVSALEYGAKLVGGVQYAAVDESYLAPEDGGYVVVVIGDPDCRANDALVDLVEAELENWRAAGVQVVCEAAEREEISVSVTVRVRTGTDTSAFLEPLRAAIIAYSDSLDPGATWYRSAAQSAAIEVSDDIADAVVSSPSANQVPTERYNAIRVNSSDLTIAFVEV